MEMNFRNRSVKIRGKLSGFQQRQQKVLIEKLITNALINCFLNIPTPNTNLSDNQTKDLRLLLLYAKQYHYVCKKMQKKQDTSGFISKFINQLEIDK